MGPTIVRLNGRRFHGRRKVKQRLLYFPLQNIDAPFRPDAPIWCWRLGKPFPVDISYG